MPRINPTHLMDDLTYLRTFGASGTGVMRPSLSPVDMAARHWLRERMAEAGLDAHIDGVGNVLGRSRNPGKALLVGSHSDTQPRGGWLDGAMGVIYGLEIVRAPWPRIPPRVLSRLTPWPGSTKNPPTSGAWVVDPCAAW